MIIRVEWKKRTKLISTKRTKPTEIVRFLIVYKLYDLNADNTMKSNVLPGPAYNVKRFYYRSEISTIQYRRIVCEIFRRP